MAKISHKVAEFLEAFLSRRPPPTQLVEQGILREAPVPSQFFGLPLTQVPKHDDVPVIVIETCTWLQENQGHDRAPALVRLLLHHAAHSSCSHTRARTREREQATQTAGRCLVLDAPHTGLSEEGLFRVPGTAEDVKIIKRDYDAGTSAHTQRAAHASTHTYTRTISSTGLIRDDG